MKKFIYIVILLSGLAVFMASARGQEKRKFRPLIAGQFTSSSIVETAKDWEGRHYRYGQSRQCANWVGEVATSSGFSLPSGHSMARSWLVGWGESVNLSSIRPGDVVITWRGSRGGSSGHILIYLGENQCIHRPTRSSPVRRISLDRYRGKILGIRRPTRK